MVRQAAGPDSDGLQERTQYEDWLLNRLSPWVRPVPAEYKRADWLTVRVRRSDCELARDDIALVNQPRFTTTPTVRPPLKTEEYQDDPDEVL